MVRILEWEPFDERERARVGDQAELYARQVISTFGKGVLLRGPLVPSMDRFGRIDGYRESDFLVYTQSTVFCIEVKSYTGTITYLPRFAPESSWLSSIPGSQHGLGGYDTSRILQIKRTRNGESVEKSYTNPLLKTKRFILLLKKYVGRIEPRFQHLFIIPVVCFASQADIRAIYNFQQGLIQIEQLPAFFHEHRNERFALQPTPWIEETILGKIPNWDRVLTTSGEWINGILVEPHLTFIGIDGLRYFLPNYARIKTIRWQARAGTPYREMKVTFTTGGTQKFFCRGGHLSLVRGKQPETFAFHQLEQLVVGLANKVML
jgi:hypothetical protein